ncbi:hypothetical protein C8R48DRAFT_670840 [Suillus tomentosus]|nr:hypothetical protein C8R48DRAFT_670840 [Suillus tomentosus]
MEKGPFHHLLTYLQSSLSDNDILHHKAICQEIMKKAVATEARLKDIVKMWDPVQGHVRCMEHTINLAARCFVTTVSPTSTCKLLKKIKAAFKHAQLEGKDVNLDALEANLEDVDVKDSCITIGSHFLLNHEPASATQTFSSSCDPSVWRMIPVLEFLQKLWENMGKLPQFSKVSDAIQKALENFVKWYHKTKDTNICFICLALDPNVKIAYAEHQWDKVSFNVGLDRLRQVFNEYYVALISVAVEADNKQGTSDLHATILHYSTSWPMIFFWAIWMVQFRVQTLDKLELDCYWTEPMIWSTVLFVERTKP